MDGIYDSFIIRGVPVLRGTGRVDVRCRVGKPGVWGIFARLRLFILLLVRALGECDLVRGPCEDPYTLVVHLTVFILDLDRKRVFLGACRQGIVSLERRRNAFTVTP